MKLQSTFAIAVATLSLAHPVFAQTTPTQPAPATTAPRSSPESADTEFVRKASEGGMKEVEAGKLASQRAANAEVRAFAQQMVTDHSKANAELTSMAPRPEAAPAQKPAAKDELAGLTGAAFDRAYMAKMVTDHQATVELFEGEARDGKDDALRSWAAQKLPTIKGHLEKAKALQAKLGSSNQ